MVMTYVKAHASGAISIITCKNPLSMKALQAHVGGNFEMVRIFRDSDLVVACVNEEGRLLYRHTGVFGYYGDLLIGKWSGRAKGLAGKTAFVGLGDMKTLAKVKSALEACRER